MGGQRGAVPGPARVVTALLRSLAQVFLQGGVATGALILAGLASVSPMVAGAALLGALSGTVTAWWLCEDPSAIGRGLHGYNGALVGLALQTVLEPAAAPFVLIVLGGVLTVFVQRFLQHRWTGPAGLPVLTAPFVLVGWAMFALAALLDLPHVAPLRDPSGDMPLDAAVRGIAQVMFQDRPLAGVLMLAGIAVGSPRVAGWALVGSTLGLAVALAAGLPDGAALGGLYGFNAALAGIALAGRAGAPPIFPLAGICLSVVLMHACQRAGIIGFTAPFVLATWLVGTLATRSARQAGR